MASDILDEVTQREKEILHSRGYRPLEPFFILKEAKIWDERKRKMMQLTREDLEEVARIQNNRIVHSGDFTPIIVGHTNLTERETSKQKACGWASRFVVAQFGRDPDTGKAVFGVRAVPWAKPENRKTFEDHPRRSVEMWTDPFLIDPISILGATTPRLDLGLHQLQRQGEPFDPIQFEEYRPTQKLRFELEDTDMPTDNNSGAASSGVDSGNLPSGGDNNALSQLFNSAEWQKLTSDVARCLAVTSAIEPMLQGMGGGDDDGMGGPPGGAPGGAGPVGPPGQGIAPGGPGGMPTDQQQPTQMNAFGGGVAPGGQNTMMPQQLHRGGYPTQMSYGGAAYAPPSYDARDEEMAQLKRTVIQLSMARESDAVAALLNDLETKIVIDRANDHAMLLSMDPTQRQAEINRWMMLRKPVDPPLPSEGVPLQMQFGGARQGQPLTLQQAHDMLALPGDPAVAPTASGRPAPKSRHDVMMEAVRNRKNGQSLDEAYRLAMGTLSSGTSVRG